MCNTRTKWGNPCQNFRKLSWILSYPNNPFDAALDHATMKKIRMQQKANPLTISQRLPPLRMP
jgi:hypothetical protein